MARALTPVGGHGKIGEPKQQPNGSFRASTRVRDSDGKLRQVHASSDTAPKAMAALQAKLRARTEASGESDAIRPNTTVADLIELWLKEREEVGDLLEQSLRGYRAAGRAICREKTGIGGLRIAQATTGRVDRFLKSAPNTRMCKVVLAGALGMAVRHGAIAVNPVREVARIRGSKRQVRALTGVERIALRERIRLWETGAQMPEDEHARQRGGQPRANGLAELMDVALGTGCRIGELLALRWSDIDFAGSPPRLTVNGTVVRSGDGLVRQEHPKTEAGYRTVLLPDFVVDILMTMKLDADRNALDLVFPTSTGTLRSPNNLNRQWRDARGLDFDWVTWHTFRRTAATQIDRHQSSDDAAAHLGHTSPTLNVTKKHYIEQATVAPDCTAALQLLGDRS